MAFFFRNKPKGNGDLARSTKDLLLRINADEKQQPRVEEELAKNLAQMKQILQGTTGTHESFGWPPGKEPFSNGLTVTSHEA